MAFSYSDKNFTVIGNLCFVHIILDGTTDTYEIPPAIAERILCPTIFFNYLYMSSKEARDTSTKDIGYAAVTSGKIFLSGTGKGYLSFHFSIDSNK